MAASGVTKLEQTTDTNCQLGGTCWDGPRWDLGGGPSLGVLEKWDKLNDLQNYWTYFYEE